MKTALNKRLLKGDFIPEFSLSDQDGNEVSISKYLGNKSLVLYFYPRDNTLGCTMESCSFRDEYEKFTEAGAEVIGISSDTIDSHKEFQNKHHLPFTLLSDLGGKVRNLFGVPSAFGFIPGRVTYVVDKNGKIMHVFNSQIQPQKHVQEALKVLKDLN
jgi:peroxiredoxin Q/BCP